MKLGIHTNIFGAIWRGDEILPLRAILPKICKIVYEGIELPLWALAEEQTNIEESFDNTLTRDTKTGSIVKFLLKRL